MSRSGAILLRHASLEQCRAEFNAAPADWLGAKERRELEQLKNANRVEQWLSGRWLGKQLLLASAERDARGLSAAEFQILTRDVQGRGVRPRIVCKGSELDCSLSISHSQRGVLAALATDRATSVGVDLVGPVPTTVAFRRAWFTPDEQRWIDAQPLERTRTSWAIKEAVYKAANAGETWNPRQIEVLVKGPGALDCFYRGRRLVGLTIDASCIDGELAVVACLPHAGQVSFKVRSSVEQPVLMSSNKTDGDCPDFAQSSEQNGTVPFFQPVLSSYLGLQHS